MSSSTKGLLIFAAIIATATVLGLVMALEIERIKVEYAQCFR